MIWGIGWWDSGYKMMPLLLTFSPRLNAHDVAWCRVDISMGIMNQLLFFSLHGVVHRCSDARKVIAEMIQYREFIQGSVDEVSCRWGRGFPCRSPSCFMHLSAVFVHQKSSSSFNTGNIGTCSKNKFCREMQNNTEITIIYYLSLSLRTIYGYNDTIRNFSQSHPVISCLLL